MAASRWKRRFLFLMCMGLLFGSIFGSLYLSSQHVPEFYQEALDDPEIALSHAVELETKTQKLVTAIKSEKLKGDSRWTETFTERECNAWLAFELTKPFPELEQEGIRNPRVHFEQDRVMLGCQLDNHQFSGVVSLQVTPQVLSKNRYALEFESAQIGHLPLPLERLLSDSLEILEEVGWSMQWKTIDETRLLIFEPNKDDQEFIEIEQIEIEPLQATIRGQK